MRGPIVLVVTLTAATVMSGLGLGLAAPSGRTVPSGPNAVGRLLTPSPTPDPTPSRSAVSYRPPVAAPVSDHFRAPTSPYGPGNRGIEYATRPGGTAGSIGAGAVVFAGRVAGRGVVTVSHADGLRSSLTGLAVVLVAVGERVEAGDVLGTTTTVLHLGVRRGADYLDPATLFGVDGTRSHAVLVPVPASR